MLRSKRNTKKHLPADNLVLVRKILKYTIVISTLAQICIFTRDSNTFASVIYCFLGSLVLLNVVKADKIQQYPISSLIMLGKGFTFFLLPLLFTTLFGRSVTNNMQVPHIVFGAALVTYFLLAFVHYFYTKNTLIRNTQTKIQDILLSKTGILTPPTKTQIWLMGLLGLITTAISIKVSASGGGVIGKVADGFRYMSFAPFMLFIAPVWSADKLSVSRTELIALAVFVLLMVALSVASATRSYMIMGLVNALLIYCLGLVMNKMRLPKIKFEKFVLIVVILSASLFLLSRVLGAAKQAGKSSSANFDSFIENIFNPDKIAAQEKDAQLAQEKYDLWDENYYGVEVLNRVSCPKLADNLFPCAMSFSSAQKDIISDLEKDKVLGMLPGPILNTMGIKIDKESIFTGSLSDNIWAITNNSPWTIGAFKAGSMMVSLYCIVGIYFPIVIAASGLLVFIIGDLFTVRIYGNKGIKTFIPIYLCLQSYSYFNIFGSMANLEAPSLFIGFITRGLTQSVLLYMFFFYCTQPIKNVKLI